MEKGKEKLSNCLFVFVCGLDPFLSIYLFDGVRIVMKFFLSFLRALPRILIRPLP